MTLDIRAVKDNEARAPHRILPVFSGGGDFAAVLPERWRSLAQETARIREFTGKTDTTLLLAYGAEQWLLTGLGEPAALTAPRFSEALARAYSELSRAGAREITVCLPPGLPWQPRQTARLAGEALHMAGYAFRYYRSRESGPPAPSVELLSPAGAALADVETGLREALAVGRGIDLTRDLINHPAAVATPGFVRDQAQTLAKELGLGFKVIQGEELAELGYGAIYAVGRGAENPPCLVALEYGQPAPDRPTVALVGKGVTFDTGGLDIKPLSSMALMKKDMGGAAIVLGALATAARLELPVHLVGVLGLAENAVDARSYRPGDVLHSKLGLTIEVSSTDAEGRIVLADALALARDCNPAYLVDFATLTGACRVALGKEVMGLFCDHTPLRTALEASAQATGDHLWRLPLWQPYRKQLDSPVADLVNSTQDSFAGAIKAALFLQAFAGEVAWAHLDCYAWSDGDSPLFPKGGSGVGVRLIVDLLSRLAEARP